MPLTKSGRKAYRNFVDEYGFKRGKSFFYAYMRKYPKKTTKWHKRILR